MSKKLVLAVLFVLLTLFYMHTTFAAESNSVQDIASIYVSSIGNDADADGSDAHPFASLAAAINKAREYLDKGVGVTIIIHGGEYMITDTIVIDESMSGFEDMPFVIKANNGERVVLYGGIHVPAERVNTVPEDDMIGSRIIDKEAVKKLMKINLEGLYDEIQYPFARYIDGTSENESRIFVGENSLCYARWPNKIENNAYLEASNVHYDDDHIITFDYNDNGRIEKYWENVNVNELRILGYLSYEWVNNINQVLAIDAERNIVKIANGLSYDPTEGTHRFYFYNLPEEIDLPGESYTDICNSTVYYYPFDNKINNIYISTLESPIISINGAKNVLIEGIDFLYTRGDAVQASNVDGLTIRGCTVAHTSSNALILSGNRIVVDGCKIYDTNKGGIVISGGDRKTLTSGESIIRNCEIHDINQNGLCYNYGIHAKSVGLKIKNNLFYNCVHGMIVLEANDIVIEYNEFHHCVTDSGDMGAIYYFYDPVLLGVEIRYNYFHDIGNEYDPINGQQAIFIDECSGGPHIYCNVFERATYNESPIKSNGAQYVVIENNIFCNMSSAYTHAEWSCEGNALATRWWLVLYDASTLDNELSVWTRLIEGYDVNSELWKNHYNGTQWEKMLTFIDPEIFELINTPEYSAQNEKILELAKLYAPTKTNVMRNNLAYNITKGAKFKGAYYVGLNGAAVTYDKSNLRITDTGDFVEYGMDYSIDVNALDEIHTKIPEFENFPMKKIGPYGNVE